MGIFNKKAIDTNVIIKTTLVFYQEKPKPDMFGSNDIAFDIYYDTKSGIVTVDEIGAFGDRTLVKRFRDRRNRGITLEEMLGNIQEMANMPYTEFKELIYNKE